MPSFSGAQPDTVHCEAPSTMVGETQSLSSQSSQGTDNILSGPEGETDTMSSQSSQSTLPEKEISIWLDEKEEQHAKRQTLNDTVRTLTDGRVSPLLSTLNTITRRSRGRQKGKFCPFLQMILVGWSCRR